MKKGTGKRLSILGIDVSHHNGPVDWNLAADSISFAFTKATQGSTYTDPRFVENWEGMKAAHVPRGAYHFFDPAADALSQASHFLSTVKLEPGDLPPVLDAETLGASSHDKVADGISTWLAEVETATGLRPILYTSPGFWQQIGARVNTSNLPLWVAHYGVTTPRIPAGWDAWTFWQFSQTGRCRGVVGHVDLNRFCHSVQDLPVWIPSLIT